jgi:hypothetical protein
MRARLIMAGSQAFNYCPIRGADCRHRGLGPRGTSFPSATRYRLRAELERQLAVEPLLAGIGVRSFVPDLETKNAAADRREFRPHLAGAAVTRRDRTGRSGGGCCHPTSQI